MATHDKQSSLTKKKAIFRQFEIIARKFYLWLFCNMAFFKRRTSGTDVQTNYRRGQWRSLSFYLLLGGNRFSDKQILHLEGILVLSLPLQRNTGGREMNLLWSLPKEKSNHSLLFFYKGNIRQTPTSPSRISLLKMLLLNLNRLLLWLLIVVIMEGIGWKTIISS